MLKLLTYHTIVVLVKSDTYWSRVILLLVIYKYMVEVQIALGKWCYLLVFLP